MDATRVGPVNHSTSDNEEPAVWRVKVWWAPTPLDYPDPAEYDMVTTEHQYPAREPARKFALHTACCRGTRGIVLYNPDGDVDGHYDRFSNIAVRLCSDKQSGGTLE